METKISKVKSLDKAGPPYARFKGAGETAQAYNMEMEDGTKALFDGEADAQPTVVGALHAYLVINNNFKEVKSILDEYKNIQKCLRINESSAIS